jgi:hypothetical protein
LRQTVNWSIIISHLVWMHKDIPESAVSPVGRRI